MHTLKGWFFLVVNLSWYHLKLMVSASCFVGTMCIWLSFPEFPTGGRDQPFISHTCHADVDPQATRSLFVGNIPKNISIYELRDIFQRFGNVLVSNCTYVCV